MRSSFWKVVGAAVVVLGTSFQAHALTIDPAITPVCGAPTCLAAVGAETAQPDIDAAIAAILGTSVEVYKQNVGGAETGVLAGSYTTTFSNTATDPSDALIDYISGPAVTGTKFLLVKDGNQTPAWYLYRLDWNGTDDIVLDNFWPGNGAISHVALYAAPGTTTVPDGGSMSMLLGLGLMGLAGVRRYLA